MRDTEYGSLLFTGSRMERQARHTVTPTTGLRGVGPTGNDDDLLSNRWSENAQRFRRTSVQSGLCPSRKIGLSRQPRRH
jgi:hypothetical protein